jgi:ribosome biogenesis GTPase A
MPDIQWFPGHMAKTGRELAESVRLADMVMEIIDARIPKSSSNPDFNKIFSGLRRLIVLNKADLADPEKSGAWAGYYRSLGFEAVTTNLRKGEGISRIRTLLGIAADEKNKLRAGRGVVARPYRAIVAGIPNSGKSTLINSLASRAAAVTGDRPGVTKRRQWIRLENGIELLDTPGVLWPKFENGEVALHLAFTGAIRDEVYDTAEAAEKLLAVLCEKYAAYITARYGDIKADGECPLLGQVGKKRGFLTRGGNIDCGRAAAIVLDEFRAAKIGRITLEMP